MNRPAHPKLTSYSIDELGMTRESRQAKLTRDNSQLAFKNRTLSATVARQTKEIAQLKAMAAAKR